MKYCIYKGSVLPAKVLSFCSSSSEIYRALPQFSNTYKSILHPTMLLVNERKSSKLMNYAIKVLVQKHSVIG